MKKTFLLSILTLAAQLAFGVVTEAQQPKKVPRIGFVSARANPTPTTPDSSADALRQGLRNLGYIEGKNIVIEYRYFEGKVDRIPSLVAELLQLKLDVLVTIPIDDRHCFTHRFSPTGFILNASDSNCCYPIALGSHSG